MDESVWRLAESQGLLVARCEALQVTDVVHGFSTRQGPAASDFDLGDADCQDPQTLARRQRWCAAVGAAEKPLLLMRQVHGNRIVGATHVAAAGAPPADGIIAARGQRNLGLITVRTADCVPVLLATDDGAAVAAIHAGWRGTASAVVGKAVAALSRLGAEPERLRAALGPAIGICCYEVEDDVVQQVLEATDGDATGISRDSASRRPHLDLRLANRRQLEQSGIPARSIHVAPWCTRCHGELFFSYRREGPPAGRMAASIGFALA